MVNYFLVSVVLFIFRFRARTEKCLMYLKPRPGREWHGIARTHTHTCHILFSCVIMAHLGLLNEKIAHIKYSFQIKSIPLLNIPFRYYLNISVIIWIWQLTFESIKKYWNLVECKRKHLTRFNVYFNFVHSLLNIIRRL